MPPKLTIGMAVYDDFDGAYFTIQALRFYQPMEDIEILVIDNYGDDQLKHWIETWGKDKVRYVRYTDITGTSQSRNMVFQEALGEWVLCIDSHVLVDILRDDYGTSRLMCDLDKLDPKNLYHGPMCYDNITAMVTHMNPVWRDNMFGIWADVVEGKGLPPEPFEIPMHGLGLFLAHRENWLGFNPNFRGFGGEEGYIHEKYRQAGGKVICLPWLRWVHRFSDLHKPTYPINLKDRINNYLIGWKELGLDTASIYEHFGLTPEKPQNRYNADEVYSYIYSHAIPGKGLYGGSPRRDGIFIEHINSLNLPDSTTFLDIGCGRGYLLRWLLASGYQKSMGTEIASSLLEPGGDLYGLPVEKLSIQDLYRCRDSRADVIISNDVIEHLQTTEEVRKALQQFARIAKHHLLISTGGHRAGRNPFPEVGPSNLHFIVQPYEWWKREIEAVMHIDVEKDAAGSLFFFGRPKK